MSTDEPAFPDTPNRAELLSAPLAELHARAAERGVERYRVLRRESLVEAILAAGPAVGAAVGGATELESERRSEPRRSEGAVLLPGLGLDATAPGPGEIIDRLEQAADAEEHAALLEEGEPGDELEPASDVSDDEEEPLEGEPRPATDERELGALRGDLTRVEGVFDQVPDGYGFLRVSGLVRSDADVYVSRSRARALELRRGDLVGGTVRPPRRSERYASVLEIDMVNGRPPRESGQREEGSFDDLTAVEPAEPIPLVAPAEDLTIRLTSLVAPVAKGQRCLIVSPPGAGATTLLWSIAERLGDDVEPIVLLVDARPEEVTGFQRISPGAAHFSTAEQSPETHVRLAELALARAKRLVESGGDVVLLLDSLSRLTRAHRLARSSAERSHGDDDRDELAVRAAKKWLASARNTEEGGSLTIIATVRTPAGSALDELLHPALSEVATTELRLDERLSENGLFPAIDIAGSHGRPAGARPGEEARRRLRGTLLGLEPVEAWKRAAELVRSTRSNDELLAEVDPES